MKKSIFLVILLLESINAFPQIGFGINIPLNHNSGRQRGQNIEDEVQRMKSDLSLDSSQVIKVRSLLVERERKMSHKEPMTGKEYDERIQGILDKDQYNKFAEFREQKRAQQAHPAKDNNYKQPDKTKDWDDVYK